MKIHDYLFNFSSELEAQSELSDWTYKDEVTGQTRWKPKKTGSGILPVSIVAAEAIISPEDDEVVLTPTIFAPGFWLVISSMEVDDEIYNMANCVQETNRPEAPTPVSKTIIRTKLQSEQYASFVRVDPVFSGASYIWGK